MDYKLPQASKRSNTPDTEEHNGLTWQTGINPFSRNPPAYYLSHGGNESTENFRRVVRPFIHENRGHSIQVLQPSVDQSTGSVATEVATSVGSSRNYMMSPSAIKTENQDLAPLNARKRVADSSNLPRKQHRHSSSASQIQGRSQLAAQEMHRKRSLTLTTTSRKLVSDTIQYLKTLSDRILIADTISSTEWVTMHLATQLLQSRYEDILAREEMEMNDVSEFNFPPTQPEERCRKCAAADEERLYD
ncbi:uncharacterized protein N7506_000075 [Penicillium brevicompactum]|uniref:uncharacterized protein n=1 Tax=Penicillium brevicompactum TaxID=5074 RepID=UPI00254095EE|nr:uncharacterized protein N7506_000075 [Penicillium brevicompactum]KAJ5346822.1 hypothetical protein N7506_000075 [Penicillium brevicompactum]